jgi:hypothetical protein
MGADQTRNVAGGQTIHVELKFNGLSFVPANLLAALTTQYGAAKVFADTDTTAQGVYRFQIIP